MRKKPLSKTVYLQGKEETYGDAMTRVRKILRVAKKLNDTESAAVRLMIDKYEETNN